MAGGARRFGRRRGGDVPPAGRLALPVQLRRGDRRRGDRVGARALASPDAFRRRPRGRRARARAARAARGGARRARRDRRRVARRAPAARAPRLPGRSPPRRRAISSPRPGSRSGPSCPTGGCGCSIRRRPSATCTAPTPASTRSACAAPSWLLAAIVLLLASALLAVASFTASRLRSPSGRFAAGALAIAALAVVAAARLRPPARFAAHAALFPPLVRVIPLCVAAAALGRLALRLAGRPPRGVLAAVPDAVLGVAALFGARLLLAAGLRGPLQRVLSAAAARRRGRRDLRRRRSRRAAAGRRAPPARRGGARDLRARPHRRHRRPEPGAAVGEGLDAGRIGRLAGARRRDDPGDARGPRGAAATRGDARRDFRRPGSSTTCSDAATRFVTSSTSRVTWTPPARRASPPTSPHTRPTRSLYANVLAVGEGARGFGEDYLADARRRRPVPDARRRDLRPGGAGGSPHRRSRLLRRDPGARWRAVRLDLAVARAFGLSRRAAREAVRAGQVDVGRVDGRRARGRRRPGGPPRAPCVAPHAAPRAHPPRRPARGRRRADRRQAGRSPDGPDRGPREGHALEPRPLLPPAPLRRPALRGHRPPDRQGHLGRRGLRPQPRRPCTFSRSGSASTRSSASTSRSSPARRPTRAPSTPTSSGPAGLRRSVARPGEPGRRAVTRFRTLERLAGASLVSVGSRPAGPTRSACISRRRAIRFSGTASTGRGRATGGRPGGRCCTRGASVSRIP